MPQSISKVALPEAGANVKRHADSDYAASDLDEEEGILDFLMEDEPRKKRICSANFLPFSLGEQRLVVFEDSEVRCAPLHTAHCTRSLPL